MVYARHVCQSRLSCSNSLGRSKQIFCWHALGNFLESNRGTVTGTITTAERSLDLEKFESRQLYHTKTRPNLEIMNDRNYG